MPIHKVSGGYKWGEHGKVYPTRAGAERQAAAAFANGYEGKAAGGEVTMHPLHKQIIKSLLDHEMGSSHNHILADFLDHSHEEESPQESKAHETVHEPTEDVNPALDAGVIDLGKDAEGDGDDDDDDEVARIVRAYRGQK